MTVLYTYNTYKDFSELHSILRRILYTDIHHLFKEFHT